MQYLPNSEVFKALNNFLTETLNGFNFLQSIDKGDPTKVIQNPSNYILNHVSGDLDSWFAEDTIVFEFNNGLHYVFSEKDKLSSERRLSKGLEFINGKWIWQSPNML